MNNKMKFLIFSIILILTSACSTTQKNTQSLRSSIEQLLISESVMASLTQKQEKPFPMPPGTKIFIDTAGISLDRGIVGKVMAGWLGQHGYHVQDDKQEATHLINIIVESLGTEYADIFFGIPPIQGSLIPISTPELAIYKAQYQTGYVKFHFDIFELPSGRFVKSTAPYLAEKYYNDYSLLFIFTFNKTDLMAPPKLGTLKRKKQKGNNE